MTTPLSIKELAQTILSIRAPNASITDESLPVHIATSNGDFVAVASYICPSGLIIGAERMGDRPRCQSKYRDAWERIWTCENEWGHGAPSNRGGIQHSAEIPVEWRHPAWAPYLQWDTAHALKS